MQMKNRSFKVVLLIMSAAGRQYFCDKKKLRIKLKFKMELWH